ncbi:MAG: response regulator [Acidimicrobiales bacterium]
MKSSVDTSPQVRPFGNGPRLSGGGGAEPETVFSSVEMDTAAANDSLLPDVVRLRVLIADDVPSTRRFLRAVLEHSLQFVVVGEAGDGDAAIELAETLQPDVVLLDLSMPIVDGAIALNGILGVVPNASIIVISGMNPSLGEPLLKAGATAFVPKGIPPFELLDRLGQILGRNISVETRAGWEAILAERRAIVCERDPFTRHLITKVLQRHDIAVAAETGTATTMLSIVGTANPDIVVLDVGAEATSDTTTISEIGRLSPRTSVIVYSAYEASKKGVLAAGAAAFVLKPRIEELAQRIQQLNPSH